jgi:hypothetical protein
MISFLSRRARDGKREPDGARHAARFCAEALESRTLLSVGLGATAQLKLLSTAGTAQSPVYHYDITLTDTGTTNIGSFWFAWVPGADFLDSTPSAATSPAGWGNPGGAPNIIAASSFDGASIQWIAGSNIITPGHSLSGFDFTTTDSPAALAGFSTTHPTSHAMTSFVYSGGLFSDLGFQFTVSPIVAGPIANKLAIASQPLTQTAGKLLAPIVVDVESGANSIINTDSSKVTVSIAGGPSGFGAGSSNVATANKGVAMFNNLKLNTAGTYTLKFTDGTLTSALSKTITIVPGLATKLAFAPQPLSGTAGKALTPAVMVKVEDAFNNVVTANTSAVKLTLSSGPTGATLTGILAANAVKGIASFANVSMKIAGGYRLKATDGLLPAATSGTITIAPTAAAKLVITQQPLTGKAGIALLPAVVVKIEDAFGNVAIGNTSIVSLAISAGPAGAIVGGAKQVHAVKGVATFSNVTLSKAGKYALKALDGALALAMSKQIVVS